MQSRMVFISVHSNSTLRFVRDADTFAAGFLACATGALFCIFHIRGERGSCFGQEGTIDYKKKIKKN